MGVRMTRMGDILARMPEIDDLDAAERAKTDHALEVALSMGRPRNWWGTGANQALLRAARDEGLPLSWIPQAATIKELAAAEDAAARLAVLIAHRDEVISDCEELLEECHADELADQVTLARKAIAAVKGGHPESGMALAVALGDPLAVWASQPRVTGFDSKAERAEWEKLRKTKGKSRHAQIEIDRLGPGAVAHWDFCYQVLIAPVPRFFTRYDPEKGDPLPEGLSRHAVAHQPTLAHFSETNTLLALMLVTSILRQMQDWIEEMGPDGSQSELDDE